MRDLICPDDTIAIAFCDLTRPVPNDRVIPWLLDELSSHPKDKIVLINATGLHRPNTEAELAEMLTDEVMKTYRVINHVATDPEQRMCMSIRHCRLMKSQNVI